MITEMGNVTRFSSRTSKGMCGAVKWEVVVVSCGRVSLSLNKTGRQPGGRQPTKQEVASEDERKEALD